MVQETLLWLWIVFTLILVVIYSSFSVEDSYFVDTFCVVIVMLLFGKIIYSLYNFLEGRSKFDAPVRNPYAVKKSRLVYDKRDEKPYSPYELLKDQRYEYQNILPTYGPKRFEYYQKIEQSKTLNNYHKPLQKNNPFQSIHIWQEPDQFGQQIQWAQGQYIGLNIQLQDAKKYVYHLRLFLRNKFEVFDSQQRSIYYQICRLGRLLFGLKDGCKRNQYLSAIKRIFKQYQKTNMIMLNSSEKSRLSKNDFQENLQKLQNKISKMTFPKFLESNSKSDMLRFYNWILSTTILQRTTINVKQVKTKVPAHFTALQLTIFYLPSSDFCYISNHQFKHCMNLEQTFLIAILHSEEYKNNPSIISQLLQ